MSKEQKLKQLLNLAIKNGFKYHTENIYLFGFYADSNKFTINKELICENTHVESHYLRWSFSINDLVLNTNFFECLFGTFHFDSIGIMTGTESYKEIINAPSVAQYYKFQWVLEAEKGTALDWLFKQFDL